MYYILSFVISQSFFDREERSGAVLRMGKLFLFLLFLWVMDIIKKAMKIANNWQESTRINKNQQESTKNDKN